MAQRERSRLQARCRQLRAAGQHSEPCNGPNEKLRDIIRDAEWRTSAPLVNDLIRIIGIYTTTPMTFGLITVSNDLGSVLYRDEIWRQKATYEARGAILAEGIVGAGAGPVVPLLSLS